jgi:hypothetical protein
VGDDILNVGKAVREPENRKNNLFATEQPGDRVSWQLKDF